MKKKMILEYLKTSFGAVFFTLLLGGLLCYLVLFNRPVDVTMPQYLVTDIQNNIVFNETEITISQDGIDKLRKHGCWLQIIDEQGKVLASANVNKKLPDHYSPSELVYYTSNSGRLDHDTLFVGEMIMYPEYGVVIGCDESYVKKYSLFLFGSHGFQKVCFIFFIVAIVVVYIASSFFSRKITTPITKIMEDIPRIAKGTAMERMNRSSVFDGVFRQLEVLQYQLQENKRMRTEWIANISHDMKTPLSTIRGYAEMLADEGYQFAPGEVRGFAMEISKSEQYMENLIQDLRLSQKLVEGKMPLQKEESNLRSMIQDSLAHIDQSQKQGNHVIIDCDDGISLCCDPNLMERCFTNIISNAFVHNPGGVRVTVRGRRLRNTVYLEIQDDGRGMDEEESRHIFERYYHGTNSQHHGGTGLGLAIARETVEAHGGTIAVESRKGRGTTFRIQLPKETPC